MRARRRVGLGLVLLLGASCGGGGSGDGGSGGDGLPACPPAAFLSASPVDVGDVDAIVPLGNLNPPGHTFPTGHMYFYLRLASGGTEPVITTLYAPGALTIVRAKAVEHVLGGYTDYSVTLAACGDISLEFGHVSSLDPAVFGDTSTLDGWTSEGEYSTGGETFRPWSKELSVPVPANTVLGTTGGRAGQWALDVGLYDRRAPSGTPANPARWGESKYLYERCVLDAYEAGPVIDGLWGLVQRTAPPGDPTPCGAALQDVPGTAHGCWFVQGTTSTYPEDPHLALAWSNTMADRPVISMGESVPGVSSQTYTYTQLATGRRNRVFTDITPDGLNYAFQLGPLTGVLAVHMPNANTLWVEHLPGATTNPATWVFTAGKTVFER